MPPPALAAGSPGEPPLTREWRAPGYVDVRVVLSVHRRGPRDPAFRITSDGALWRTSRTPDGPGTLRVTAVQAAAPAVRAAVTAQAAGPAQAAGAGRRRRPGRHGGQRGRVGARRGLAA